MWSASSLEHRTLDAGGRCVGFETSFASATADASGFVDHYVAQLAGESVVAVDQLAVCDETAAQSGTEGDHQEIFHALRTAVDHFTYGAAFASLVMMTGTVGKKALHLLDDIQHALPDEVRCELDCAGIVVAVRGADTDTHSSTSSPARLSRSWIPM